MPTWWCSWIRPDTITGVMIEPLTEAERVVLRYLRGHLAVDEIARVLHVSPNTIKTHIRHVYRKLGVRRRRDAVLKSYLVL